jgi:hypothetical protein
MHAMEATLAGLADVARVPAARRLAFSELARPGIEKVVFGAGAQASTDVDAFVGALAICRDVEDLATELRRRLEVAAPAAIHLPDAQELAHTMLDGALRRTNSNVADVVRLLDAMRSGWPRVGPSTGRPTRHSWVRQLISHLEVSALVCGGDFTISKSGEGGTLVVGLEMLRPHLPRGVLRVRGTHPLSTYNRVLTAARALARQFVWPVMLDALARGEKRVAEFVHERIALAAVLLIHERAGRLGSKVGRQRATSGPRARTG